MIRILDLALKDLLQSVREKLTFMFLLVMPIVFTLIFGFAFGGFGGGNGDPRLPVGYLDQDNGQLGPQLVELLNSSEVIRLEDQSGKSVADLEKKVADQKLAAALIIPSGYTEQALAGTPAKLTVYADTANTAGMTAQGTIQTAANRMMNSLLSAHVVTQSIGDAAAGLDATVNQILLAWQDPPIQVQVTQPSIKKDNSSNAFTHSAPGMMAQFSIAGLIAAAQIIVSERRTRCMQRLLTTAISRWSILLGHYLAMFMLSFIQLFILMAFGQLFLRLDYLSQPVASLLMMVTLAAFVAALGIFIGALAKTEEQAIVFSIIPMLVLSAIGGAWMPLEFTGKTFQAIGHLSPVAWVMDGIKNIIARGLGLDSVLVPAAALLGYAVLFFILGAWKFKYE
jgi:ABC-2 type transport system permease protein